jgi:hypothetical protein
MIPELYRPISKMIIGKLIECKSTTATQLKKYLRTYSEDMVQSTIDEMLKEKLLIESWGALALNSEIVK